MKQILLTVAIIITLYSQTSAQIQKGARLLEGVISFNSSSSKNEFYVSNWWISTNAESKATSFSFQPKIGFFTSETFLVGIGADYEYSSYESSPSSKQKTSLYFLNPYIRKYFVLKEKLFFTVSLNVLVGGGRDEYHSTSNVLDIDVFEWRTNVTPGLTYFVSNQWAVTANFGQLFYNYRKETVDHDLDDQPDNVDKSFGASFQFNTFGIGIQYYLRNKTE